MNNYDHYLSWIGCSGHAGSIHSVAKRARLHMISAIVITKKGFVHRCLIVAGFCCSGVGVNMDARIEEVVCVCVSKGETERQNTVVSEATSPSYIPNSLHVKQAHTMMVIAASN